MNTKRKIYILGALLLATVGVAGPIKVWAASEYITAADINANFAHLHASVGHNHGAVITNADISASAGIAHTKLATPGLLPKGWILATNCAGAGCTTTDSSGGIFNGVSRTSAGVYTVNLSPARANATFAVIVSSASSTVDRICHGKAASTTTVSVWCEDAAAAAAESDFSLLLLDTDN